MVEEIIKLQDVFAITSCETMSVEFLCKLLYGREMIDGDKITCYLDCVCSVGDLLYTSLIDIVQNKYVMSHLMCTAGRDEHRFPWFLINDIRMYSVFDC